MQRKSHASGRTRGHQVARLQGHEPRNIRQQLRRAEQHIRRRATLTHLTVHRAGQLQTGERIHLIGAHNDRAKRSHRIPVLTLEPLRRTALPIAHRHVVDDRVAHQRLPRLLLGGVAQAHPDHQAQLNLPVNLRATRTVVGGHADLLAGANQRIRELRKERRVFGHLKFHLLGVIAVVQARAHNLAGLIQRPHKGQGFPQLLTVAHDRRAVLLQNRHSILRVAEVQAEPAVEIEQGAQLGRQLVDRLLKETDGAAALLVFDLTPTHMRSFASLLDCNASTVCGYSMLPERAAT